jgi:hypothetical protein
VVKTQTQQVLDALRERGPEGLTPLDAQRWIGTMRLAARVSDAKELLDDDEEIITERFRTPGGAVVARYVLRRRTVREAVPMTLWPETGR